jgi:hypothetical protein
MGGYDLNGSWGDRYGVDSVGSGLGLVMGCCECCDEALGSGATELVPCHNTTPGDEHD